MADGFQQFSIDRAGAADESQTDRDAIREKGAGFWTEYRWNSCLYGEKCQGRSTDFSSFWGTDERRRIYPEEYPVCERRV